MKTIDSDKYFIISYKDMASVCLLTPAQVFRVFEEVAWADSIDDIEARDDLDVATVAANLIRSNQEYQAGLLAYVDSLLPKPAQETATAGGLRPRSGGFEEVMD